MTTAQSLITIGIIALGTVFTRFLPFWLFPKGKPAPRIVAYLGKVLPCAVMGLLVVYCLKDVQPAAAPYGLPELIAVAATAGLHVWKKNTLLSVGVGTVHAAGAACVCLKAAERTLLCIRNVFLRKASGASIPPVLSGRRKNGAARLKHAYKTRPGIAFQPYRGAFLLLFR